ncbi:MAG: PIG-L family deacetylase [Chloroflexia bacterium]
MNSRSRVARRMLRLIARRLLYPSFEHIWAALFLVARLLLRPSPRNILFTGRDRVIVVAPHPDDEMLGCGGAVIKHAAAGDQVEVLIVTDGGASRARGLSRPEMVRLRALEAQRAVTTLHPAIRLTLGALPEGEWDGDALSSILTKRLHEIRPTIIYAPSYVDFHPEHLAIARCLSMVLRATLQMKSSMKLRVYELQVPLTLTLINRKVQLGEEHSKKMAALGEYWTQGKSFSWQRRQERYLKTLLGSDSPVEVFWEMEIGDYVRIMNRQLNPQTNFRSMRPRPFSDGLAWLLGTRTRQRLRHITRHPSPGE